MTLLLALLLACEGPKTETAETADACDSLDYDVTWANFGDGFFSNYCRGCHSADTPDRYDAPEGIDFDTIEDVRQWESLIRYTVIDQQTMPLGGGVYDQDLEFLGYFLDCGLN